MLSQYSVHAKSPAHLDSEYLTGMHSQSSRTNKMYHVLSSLLFGTNYIFNVSSTSWRAAAAAAGLLTCYLKFWPERLLASTNLFLTHNGVRPHPVWFGFLSFLRSSWHISPCKKISTSVIANNVNSPKCVEVHHIMLETIYVYNVSQPQHLSPLTKHNRTCNHCM